MKISEVAKRYAKALVFTTKQNGTSAQSKEMLEAIAKAITLDKATWDFFVNPTISTENKKASLQSALQNYKASQEIKSFVELIAEKNRIPLLVEINEAFKEILDTEAGLTRGQVVSAKPLSDESKRALEEKISKTLNKKVSLTYKEDSSLVGGMLVQVSGWTFDDSVRTHLKRMVDDLHRSE